MKRWVWFLVCAILGLVMLALGLAIPAHLRAVDARVIEKAGAKSTGLVDEGVKLAAENKLGAAQLLLKAADEESIPRREQLRQAVTNLAKEHPGFLIWGGAEPELKSLLETESGTGKSWVSDLGRLRTASGTPVRNRIAKAASHARTIPRLYCAAPKSQPGPCVAAGVIGSNRARTFALPRADKNCAFPAITVCF